MQRSFELWIALVFVCALAIIGARQAEAKIKATMSTSAGGRIYSDMFAGWIENIVDPRSKRLVILTECYGGNAVGDMAGRTNTAVASATSPGEQAQYGAYDWAAAWGLYPSDGRTAKDIHDEATKKNAKDGTEHSSSGGGLALQDFSLEETSAGGAVQSRHIVVYAGQPDAKPLRDNVQQDCIKVFFQGQYHTTVTAVGGNGQSKGWTSPGTAKGLREALINIGITIANSADPSKEQLIVFVTDHGDLHNVEEVNLVCTNNASIILTNIPSFSVNDLEPKPLTTPGFSVFVPFSEGLTHAVNTNSYQPFFRLGAWYMRLSAGNDTGFTNPVYLTECTELYDEYDDDIIGTSSNEGVTLFFPMSPAVFTNRFFDTSLNAQIYNSSGSNYMIGTFSQDSGPVAKGPEDNDADGISDPWEMQTFGGLTNANETSDHDGDKASDLIESLAGTDPTNADSCLRLSSVQSSGTNGMALEWQSVSDKTYYVGYSTNLNERFNVLTRPAITATPPVNVYTGASPGFYRIGIE